MRLFLDANVLLDVLLARQPFVNDSERVLSLCAKKVFDGCCSGLTICNLMYILRKHCPMDVARRCMRDFSTYVEIVDVKSTAVASAQPPPQTFSLAVPRVNGRKVMFASVLLPGRTADLANIKESVWNPDGTVRLVVEVAGRRYAFTVNADGTAALAMSRAI